MRRFHNKAYTDSLWTEIETLQWVSAQSLSVRRRLLDGQREEEKQNKTFAGLKYTKQHAIIIDADISASY
jgi:hypothetical protein